MRQIKLTPPVSLLICHHTSSSLTFTVGRNNSGLSVCGISTLITVHLLWTLPLVQRLLVLDRHSCGGFLKAVGFRERETVVKGGEGGDEGETNDDTPD